MATRLLLCGSIPPEWGGKSGGGVASFHRILIDELRTRGQEYGVEIAGLIPFNLDPSSSHRPPVEPVLEADGDISEAEFYERTLKVTGADAVVFQHVAHRWAIYHGRLKSRVPALGVIHSWNAVRFRPPEAAQKVRQTIERALPACNSLVFVSEYTRAEGEALGFSYPEKVSVVHNPISPIYLQDLPADGQHRDGWVFLGSLIGRKNPATALEASVQCGKSLTFVGDGPEEAALRSAARRLGVEDHVSFLGWASPERVRQLLLRAELLCVPSLGEGFSVAYLEALACGTPVIGAGPNLDELNQRVGMNCGAGVWNGTVDEVVAGARSVQESMWDRAEIHRRVVQAFSPAAVTSAYVSVIREMTTATCRRVEGTR